MHPYDGPWEWGRSLVATRRTGRVNSAIGAGLLGLLAAGMTSFSPPTAGRGSAGSTPDGFIDTVIVRRIDLETTLLAGGDLMPAKQTTVTCEVEDLDRGPDGGGDLGTLILSVVPNGTTVRKGDVLCVLDSSGFAERLRLEQIEVEAARSDHRHAELTLETTGAASREYREGTVLERTKASESRSALLRSDFEGQRAHVAWAERMFQKGYHSRAAVLGTAGVAAHRAPSGRSLWRSGASSGSSPRRRRSAGSRVRSRGPRPLSASNRCG